MAEALDLLYENPAFDTDPGELNPMREMIKMARRGEIHPMLQAVCDFSAMVQHNDQLEPPKVGSKRQFGL